MAILTGEWPTAAADRAAGEGAGVADVSNLLVPIPTGRVEPTEMCCRRLFGMLTSCPSSPGAPDPLLA